MQIDLKMNPFKWPPQYDFLKIIIIIGLLIIAGFFVFKYMHFNFSNTGRVVETGNQRGNTQPVPSVPLVSILPATEIAATSARLNATVPVMDQYNTATLYFMYGKTDKFGLVTTPFAVDGKASAPITDLSCNTTYYYRLVAQNAVGKSGSKVETFKTLPCNGRTPIRTGAPVVR